MRHWGLVLLLIALLVASAGAARGAHKPHYKGSVDTLDPGAWEAHFVWLRSDYFNYLGDVWWEISVEDPGRVDVHFFDLANFAAFRDGADSRPMLDPLVSVSNGAQSVSELTGDLPYFLVLRNAGVTTARVTWTIFAEIDWRRWQGQPHGPEWNLTTHEASPLLDQGGSWETTFTESAVYVYHCHPHPSMTGIVEVAGHDESPRRVNVTIDEMGFHPEIIRVPVGTTVNWTNLDNLAHSVHLGLVEGGFVIPQGGAPPIPAVTLVVVVGIVLLNTIVVVVLQRRRRPFGGTSKTDAPDRNESDRTNRDK